MWFPIAGKEGNNRKRLEYYESRLRNLLRDVITLQSEGKENALRRLLDSLAQISVNSGCHI